jgi:hypothetical protein
MAKVKASAIRKAVVKASKPVVSASTAKKSLAGKGTAPKGGAVKPKLAGAKITGAVGKGMQMASGIPFVGGALGVIGGGLEQKGMTALVKAQTAVGPYTGGGAVKEWTTGTAQFWRTADGRIHTIKKNGVEKSWRPYHPLVLGKRIKVGQLRRVSYRIHSLARSLSTVINITTPHRRGGRKK